MTIQIRIFVVLLAALAVVLCQPATAQYVPPPMGAPMAGSPGYVPPAHGYQANPALIGGLAAGGAAAAGGIFYFMHHHNVYQGCVGQDGKSLIRKDGKHFQLDNTSPLTPGDKVAVKAKKSGDDGSTLEVSKLKKDYGPCEPATAGSK